MSGQRQQITLKPEVLRWARERADYKPADLARKVGVASRQVEEWESTGRISLAQLEKLSDKTHTPRGFLYLAEPPREMDRLPIPDFRGGTSQLMRRPSVDLLETVRTMQGRQAWMREELVHDGVDEVSVVGDFSLNQRHDEVADAIRMHLGLEREWALRMSTWEGALRHLRDRIEDARILVVFNGTVGNNSHRKLDREEFQGFALVDNYAPMIFVNSADYKPAHMFTLGDELAHIFIGATGVSRFEKLQQTENQTEVFCNRVAAEFLVPEDSLKKYMKTTSDTSELCSSVARYFKVGTVVAARRLLDLNLIDPKTLFDLYNDLKMGDVDFKSRSGGNFWKTQRTRIGRPFGVAVARAVAEGRLFYRDAYRLTGLSGASFDKLMRQVSEW